MISQERIAVFRKNTNMKSLRSVAIVISLLILFSMVGCRKKGTTNVKGTGSSEPVLSSASVPASVTQTPTLSPVPSDNPTSNDNTTEQTLHFEPKVTAAEGGNLVVSVELSGNEGIAGYGISLMYDDEALEYISATYDIKNVFSATNVKTPGRVCLMCTVSGGNKINENGVINTVTFKLKDGVTAGKLDFELKLLDEKDTVFTYDIATNTSSEVDCVFGKTEYTVG